VKNSLFLQNDQRFDTLRPDQSQEKRHEAPAAAPPSDGDAARSAVAAETAADSDTPPSRIAADLVAQSPAPERLSIPGYEILAELGRGGMGVVYQARQIQLDRVVALKMILSGAHAGPQDLVRFRNEAETVARVQHPNLVQIYEIGDHEGRPFFSLEYVDGGNLGDQIRSVPQPPDRCAELIEALGRAVHAMHCRDIIHRDLKPANVLLTSDGVPKIADFGLAKRLDSNKGATVTGDILGTPMYMSPEQAAGRTKDIGPASDIYALGSILYEMLTGRPPFQAETGWDVVMQVVKEEPVAPSRVHGKVPRDLEIICLKCLEKEPRRRYLTADELAEDLRRYRSGEPIRARRVNAAQRALKWAKRRPALAALAGVTLVATLILLGGGWLYNLRLRSALQEAHDKGEESRLRLVRLNVTNGTRSVDEGDLFSALVWYAQALRLDDGDTDREAMHRLRLASVIRQCPRLEQIWFHQGAVRAARFSPDGRLAVTASADGTARICETDSGAAVGSEMEHDGAVVDVMFRHDGKQLVTASADGMARVWNVATGKLVVPPLAHKHALVCAAFSPDGRWIVTAGDGPAACLWNAVTGKKKPFDLRHQGAVHWASFSPNSKWVITAGDDHLARVWDVNTGEPVGAPLQHSGPVNHAQFSPDSVFALTASADSTARVWRADSGAPVTPLLTHQHAIVHAAFSPDGRWVATASDDRSARVWNAVTGAPRTDPMRHGSGINFVSFSPNGAWLLTAGDDNTARLWDAATGEAMPPFFLHHGTVHCAVFHPDNRRILTASNDTLVRLWEASGGQQGRFTLIDEANQKNHLIDPKRLGGQRDATRPDGTRIVKAHDDFTVRVSLVETGAPLGAPMKHGSAVTHVCFAPDGKRIATTSNDNMARVWDAETGRLLASPMRHHGTPVHASFSPDGKLLVTAANDETARVWDASTGEPITPPLAHHGPVKHACFCAASRNVVTVSGDGTQRFWELRGDDRPTADLVRFAELVSASRIQPSTGLLPLDAEQVRALWSDR
jgi:WD40 repeat protein